MLRLHESWMSEADGTQRPDGDPQRRESILAANVLLVKAVIQEAVQRSPDDPDQYQLADFLTTAPEPLRDPDLAPQIGPAGRGAEAGGRPVPAIAGLGTVPDGRFSRLASRPSRSANDGESGFIMAMALLATGREDGGPEPTSTAASEWLKGYEQRCEEP